MSFGLIHGAVDQFRSSLDAKGGYVSQVMVQMYKPAYDRLVAEGDVLARKIAQAKANGEPLGQSWLFQQDRIQSLRRAVGREVKAYARQADGWLGGTGLQSFVNQAVLDAKGLAVAQGLRGGWVDLNTDALTAIVGAATGPRTSPLRQLFSTLGAGVEDDLTGVFATAIVTGMGPEQTARELRRVAQIPLTRARTIARTETFRAYREASRQSFLRNKDLLHGWVWYSGLDRRTCVACWAMHGTRHDVGARMDAHVNCRCTMIPLVDGGTLDVEPGPQAFDKLSEADQRAILGPGKYDLYKGGKADLGDMVKVDRSDKWGRSIREASIQDTKATRLFGGQPDLFHYPAKTLDASAQNSLQRQAEAARARITQLGLDMDRDVGALQARLDELGRQHQDQWDIIRGDRATGSFQARQDATTRARELSLERARVMADYLDTKEGYIRKMRESLVVDNPSRVNIVMEDVNGKVLAKHKKDWRAGADWFGRFTTRQQAQDAPFRYVPNAKMGTGRSYEIGGKVYMAKMDGKTATAIHELGHWLEEVDQGAGDAARAFLKRRTQGEANIRLMDVFPKHGYQSNEVTKLDKFVHPYMGKDYGFGGTEITSMGLQMFYEDAWALARDDPDMFDFIYRMVRGGS